MKFIHKFIWTLILLVLTMLSASRLPAQDASTPTRQGLAAGKMKVAILIFEGVQIVDYTGPYEVFGQAGFEVFTVAKDSKTITTNMGMSVNPTYTLANSPAADILMLPGGNVPDQADPAVIQWIQKNAAQSKIVFSVCNGAFYLAQSGLLDGLQATTFAGLIDSLRVAAPKTKVVSDKRYVDNGKVITTAGLSSGIDGALHVVERLFGRPYAQAVATGMEYNWDPQSKYVRAQLADNHLRGAMTFMRRYDRDLVKFDGNTDTWSITWNVHSKLTPANVLDAINENLATNSKWKRSAAQDAGKSTWSFVDDRGRAWTGQANVTPVSGQSEVMSVDLKVSTTTKSAQMN